MRPALSIEGRVLVFESRAALATDGADTGVPQVFAYDTRTTTFAQVTADPAGCVRPAVARVKRDWRITFVCAGAAQFYMLRADERLLVGGAGGDTNHVAPQFGIHFLALTTTADLLLGGTAPRIAPGS